MADQAGSLILLVLGVGGPRSGLTNTDYRLHAVAGKLKQWEEEP